MDANINSIFTFGGIKYEAYRLGGIAVEQL